MIYVLIGGPATGKGTRSEILAKALKIPHISTGELLRKVSETNEIVSRSLAKGELIPDEAVTEVLYDRIKEPDCVNGFILDGYPRTLIQARLLEVVLKRINQELTMVIELIVSEDIAFRRVLERRECDNCGKLYGVDFPPKVEGICDDCGGKLTKRSDDTRETLRNRIALYGKNSAPILAYYKEKKLLKTIDASSHPEKIVEEIHK